ncbi:MAG: hypothetical protein JOZ41_07425 [Chloroflexi bacterium]|nr:hypothetical protein [Chloroflexota bacterium]
MDEQGIYEDPGTGGATPTTEGSRPEGGGVHSGSADGRNKVDPVSAGPNLGSTIAGRTGTAGGLGPAGAGGAATDSMRDAPTGTGSQTGSTKTGGRGVTGHTGREPGEGDPGSKGAAASDTKADADGNAS